MRRPRALWPEKRVTSCVERLVSPFLDSYTPDQTSTILGTGATVGDAVGEGQALPHTRYVFVLITPMLFSTLCSYAPRTINPLAAPRLFLPITSFLLLIKVVD